MSESEEYLDGLLDSVASGKNEDVDNKGDAMRSEKDFMKDFENDMLSEGGEEEFLKAFEQELQGDAETEGAAGDDLFFENIDGIVNSVKQEMDTKQQEGNNEDALADMLENVSETDEGAKEEDNSSDGLDSLDALVKEVSATGEAAEEESLVDNDQDLMDLLQSEEGLSDIGDMLNADENNEPLDDTGIGNFAEAEMENLNEEEPEKKKEGFFAKLGRILFGEDEEENEEKKPTEKVSVSHTEMPDIEELSDENLQILQELDGGDAEVVQDEPKVETEEEKKAREKEEKKAKKAKKKEEKEKKKKEKQAQKAAKPKKEKPKKEKPPKVPDNTPPLPKVPVILIFIMAGSFFALVMIATNLMGYSNSFIDAEDAYNDGNYELAYQQVSGMEIKEADLEQYEKYKVMATVSAEYSAYESLMQQELYDMALDSLLRTIGRCEKYASDAKRYGCAGNVENVKAEAVGALSTFGIGEEEAMTLYNMDDRSEYSKEVYRIIKAAGLEKVTEE